MEWTVLLDDDFEAWLLEQTQAVRVSIASHIALLAKAGPTLEDHRSIRWQVLR